jgi:hypothetical protein
MRSTPTIVVSSFRLYDGAAAPAVTSIAGQASSTTIASVDLTASAGGLTSGKAVVVIENGTSSYLELTAEL